MFSFNWYADAFPVTDKAFCNVNRMKYSAFSLKRQVYFFKWR